MNYSNYCSSENPMVDTDEIKRAMHLNGVTLTGLAAYLGVNERTIRNRMKYGNWTVLEAYKVCVLFNLDFEEVFFAYPEAVSWS